MQHLLMAMQVSIFTLLLNETLILTLNVPTPDKVKKLS